MLVEEQKLEAAVEQCMDAACNEFEPQTQKRLLKVFNCQINSILTLRLIIVSTQ